MTFRAQNKEKNSITLEGKTVITAVKASSHTRSRLEGIEKFRNRRPQTRTVHEQRKNNQQNIEAKQTPLLPGTEP